MMLPAQPQRLARKMAAWNVHQPTGLGSGPATKEPPGDARTGGSLTSIPAEPYSPSLPDGEKSHG